MWENLEYFGGDEMDNNSKITSTGMISVVDEIKTILTDSRLNISKQVNSFELQIYITVT